MKIEEAPRTRRSKDMESWMRLDKYYNKVFRKRQDKFEKDEFNLPGEEQIKPLPPKKVKKKASLLKWEKRRKIEVKTRRSLGLSDELF